MKVLRLALAAATAAAFAGCATEGNQDKSNSSGSAQPAARSAGTTPAPAPAPHSASGIMTGAPGARTAPMTRSIYYAYDRAEVTQESRKVIEANAEYLRANPVKTIMGEIKFGKAGEWAQSRMLQVQYHDIKGNTVDQFKGMETQTVLTPRDLKTGGLIYPYEKAK